MNYIDHDHKHTVKRGGSIMSGSSNYQDDNVVIDTPEYNKFDLSHSFKTTGKCGVINPCLNLPVIPGDNLQMRIGLTQYFRPLQTKIVNELETSLHTFYVPYRMLDYGFEKFITGGVDGKYNRPLLNFKIEGVQDADWNNNCRVHSVPLFGAGSLLDAFNYGVVPVYDPTSGVPVYTYAATGKFNLFPLIAYHRIYNDYYRAEEIETDLWCPIETVTGGYFHGIPQDFDDAIADLIHIVTSDNAQFIYLDEFVNALHTDSRFKGFGLFMLRFLSDPVFIPTLHSDTPLGFDIGTNTFDSLNDDNLGMSSEGKFGFFIPANDSFENYYFYLFQIYLLSSELMPWERDRFTTCLPYLQRGVSEYIDKNIAFRSSYSIPTGITLNYQYFNGTLQDGKLYHGNAMASSGAIRMDTSIPENRITMDDIRRLNAVTRFLEKNARIGYRFDEWISGIFGIETKHDDILAKPTYIGGLKNNVDITRITATAETDSVYLGDYAGQATGFADSDQIDFACKEHGIIIGVYGTKPRASYMYHVDRSNMKYADRTIFFTPDFAKLQEQPVFAGEIQASAMDYTVSDLINGKVDATGNPQFFGYAPRYEEYRSAINTTHGELTHNLSYFTTARTEEGNDPSAGVWIPNDYDFQHVSPEDPCVNRIFPYSEDVSDHFVTSVGFQISKLSLMTSQATPAL